MRRKFLSTLLALCMLTAFVPCAARAETGTKYGDYLYYEVNDDGTGITITDCDTAATDIIIPDRIEGLPVTAIGYGAFQLCYDITNINIPYGVTYIDQYAFMYCNSLEKIYMPDSITYIGYGAFSSCKNLRSITIPNSVTYIASGAFGNCTQLKTIFIPDGVEFIGKHAFFDTACYDDINNWTDGAFYIGNYLLDSDSENMGSECKIRNGTKYITSNAFYGCEQLTTVYIPDSLVSISGAAFAYCKNLKSADIPDGVTYIGPYAFRNCEGLTNVNIPSSVVSIDAYAFYDCSNLTSVNIPSGVISIGDGVFTACYNLTSVIVNKETHIANMVAA